MTHRMSCLVAVLAASALAGCDSDAKSAGTKGDGGGATAGQDASSGQGRSDGGNGNGNGNAGDGGNGSAGDGGDSSGGDGAMPPGKKVTAIYGDLFAQVAGYRGNAEGAVLAVLTPDGMTTLSMQASGLAAIKMYTAHVHVAACADGDGGGHYLLDAASPAGETNEIWLKLDTDVNGRGRVVLTVPHALKEGAKSVVLHDTGGKNPKILCADLVGSVPFVTTGDATVLLGAMTAGVKNLAATGTMTRSGDGTTTAKIQVEGLKPSEEYYVHVHDEPCSVLPPGGGHYKNDYAEAMAVESNEIWLNFTSDAAGKGEAMVSSNHVARAEAQSMVIHGNDVAKTRLACIQLARK